MTTSDFLIPLGILLPFLGTAFGAAAVWIVPKKENAPLRKGLYGFAAGVMLASLVWSLLIPAIEKSDSVFPALTGFLSGVVFFLACETFYGRADKKGLFSGKQKMIFAVTLHNLPEGMAVGVAFASALADPSVGMGSAMLLSVGITLQNLPEGSIVSAPLPLLGYSRKKAFGIGVLSGAVEPLGAVAALLITSWIEGLLPFVLSFAAGAMLYVAADELIPELQGEPGKKTGLLSIGVGFALMMAMDVIFG